MVHVSNVRQDAQYAHLMKPQNIKMKLNVFNAIHYIRFPQRGNVFIVVIMKLEEMGVNDAHIVKKIKNMYALNVIVIFMLSLITQINVYLIERKMK